MQNVDIAKMAFEYQSRAQFSTFVIVMDIMFSDPIPNLISKFKRSLSFNSKLPFWSLKGHFQSGKKTYTKILKSVSKSARKIDSGALFLPFGISVLQFDQHKTDLKFEINGHENIPV